MTHARLGAFAKWTCDECTWNQYPGRFACRCCCGYTTSPDKVVRGVLTLKGRPLRGCLR